eukprot:CAMPEP_0197638178 /NCGR_PEP_ID=MMETSP1338-20131121/13177_1 /TAXON_ID=43686 ORGANISM="Pelagodinium beii, Strain RCC1491" /NCGR_SAMPLE_ID=MMETSP1338 /ASSEMBLY_ACC=CAM_ASM_000754 /LENGTH=186 /DNA_ID=CAMNT_0043210709 /DNA_START=33 /DNA_END=590 /DNA_ORIENTATION=-
MVAGTAPDSGRPHVAALAGGIAGPSLLRPHTCLPSVRRRRAEVRDAQQVHDALHLPERLLIHPNPRFLGSDCDALALAMDRGKVCVVEDVEAQAFQSLSAETSAAIRALPKDHKEWASNCQQAKEEEEIFKQLRALTELRRPLREERTPRSLAPRGGCGFKAVAQARGDPEMREVSTSAPVHPCGP